MSDLLAGVVKMTGDPLGCILLLFGVLCVVMFVGGVWWDVTERKDRLRRAELAAEREREKGKQEQSRYKTARVMERGQKRQHRHERDTQYPARPLPPRQTRPALPPHEDDEREGP